MITGCTSSNKNQYRRTYDCFVVMQFYHRMTIERPKFCTAAWMKHK